MKMFLFVGCFWAYALAAQVPQRFNALQLSYTDTLYFASGSAVPDGAALAVLAAFPAPASATDRVYLTAHTDAIGDLAYNEKLAQERARAAREVLLQHFWRDTTLLVQTFGERQPAAGNDREQDRQRNRRVTLDLFRAVPHLRWPGQVTDPATGEGIANATIRVHSRSLADTLSTDRDGKFVLELPLDSIVGIDVYALDHFFYSEIIKVKPNLPATLRIGLAKAAPGAVADIGNLFFVGNQAVLLPKSQPELPKVQRFLEVNAHLKVEIAGHVNYPNRPPVTEDSDEWDLSVRRARMVYDYAIQHGIPPAQVSYQGYGNHEMRFPKAQSEAEQAQNRRVEIRVVGKME
ncbi:MAG: hypothetical protein DA408_19270 [Bacteroidetes bacterium]|nr:MAG: hypothetical protein C7N36_10020 [Bacteroidota bacterium]PTM09017.1 MAG: hypothetical protein DA408_19270 [Bacteroidota bacterium]